MAKKKSAKKDSVGSVTFNTKKIRGKTYGVSAVNASLGGTDLGSDLVAVIAGDEKRVTTLKHAAEWFAKRGLDRPGEAEKFIEEGIKADEIVSECPSCGEQRPGAIKKGGHLFKPGSVCPKCKHVEPDLDAEAKTNGPPPDWKPTAESPTWEDLRSLAVRVLELLGDEVGAASKLNGRQFYALACLAAIHEGDEGRVFGAEKVGLDKVKVV